MSGRHAQRSAERAAKEAIKAARDAINQHIQARDAEGLSALFAADIRLVDGVGDLTLGREAVVDGFRLILADADFTSHRLDGWRIQIAQSGDIASEWGRWESIWQGDKPRRLAGDYHAMWRSLDGAWRIQAELHVCLEPGIAPSTG